MTAVGSTYTLSTHEQGLLGSLVDAKGVILGRLTHHDLRASEASAEAIYLRRSDDSWLELSPKWVSDAVGNRMSALRVSEASPVVDECAEIKICDAWIREISILSAAHHYSEIEVDSGLELVSHTHEVASISIMDPRDQGEKYLLVQGPNPQWMLGGLDVTKRSLELSINSSNSTH